MLLVNTQAENPDYGVSSGAASRLVMIWGIFNALGRFTSGRLGDYGLRFPIFTSYSIFITGLSISAVALLVFPFTMHFGDIAFITFVSIYGFTIAPLVTMRSMLVSDMYGSSHAKASFGWFLSAQGAVMQIGFVMPALLNEMGPFFAYLFGAVSFITSALFVAITYRPFFKARDKAIKKEKAKKRYFEKMNFKS